MTKTMIIMAGLPASGKSTYIKANLSDMAVVDCDQFKATIPGYDPKNPGAVHAQSKVMEKEAIYTNLANGHSFIYDTTATNSDKALALILEAQSLGYTVEVHYMNVSLQTALARNAARERTVATEIILDKFEKINASMTILKQYADRFVQVDND